MVTIYSDLTYPKEREYIYDVIFRHFWGLDYKVIYEPRRDIRLSINNRNIFIDDSFFHHDDRLFLKKESLPKLPLDVWIVKDKVLEEVITDNSLPIIYGNRLSNGEFIQAEDDDIILGIDVFGAAFFMLTRYEEVVVSDRDKFERFSAEFSLAYKASFLERPIINEYLEILWTLICKVGYFPARKVRSFDVMPTHDVDRLSTIINFQGSYHYRRFLGDIFVRKSFSCFFNRTKIIFSIFAGDGFKSEWKYTFDKIMDISDQHNVKSTFFFMATQNYHGYNGDYNIGTKDVVDLIEHIIHRGHNIGIHPEFCSYNNFTVIKDNVETFRQTLFANNIQIDNFGGRQHYLKWDVDTWHYYDANGLCYDTTLSYADHIGFRCGICYEFPVYDVKRRQVLRVIEYPLIVMEGSGLEYMGLSLDEMGKRTISLKNKCRKYCGNFVFLWHNDMFIDDNLGKLYVDILRA